MKDIIALKRHRAILISKAPVIPGEKIDFQIKLPRGALLECFSLSGRVTRCEPAKNKGGSGYVLEIEMGRLSETNRAILDAYMDFLERKKFLADVKMDTTALEALFADLGQKLGTLRARSEMLRSNLHGVLEMIKGKEEEKKNLYSNAISGRIRY